MEHYALQTLDYCTMERSLLKQQPVNYLPQSSIKCPTSKLISLISTMDMLHRSTYRQTITAIMIFVAH